MVNVEHVEVHHTVCINMPNKFVLFILILCAWFLIFMSTANFLHRLQYFFLICSIVLLPWLRYTIGGRSKYYTMQHMHTTHIC